MSDVIRLLPDAIANQIAAGEVIQRPASVVKELMENAVDAKATDIKLIVKEGGKTLIQVIDNGVGMNDTDARMCWERHATSKISQAADLFKIRTMGFRGEALASIAAIAHVELKTKQKDEELGCIIQIEGSEVKKQEAIATTNGTTITVKNLFFNVPARRNFLKSIPVETKHIIEEFTRVALAHPEISFSLHNGDNEVFDLPSGELKTRVMGIFGDKCKPHLLPADEHTDIVAVTGFVGTPESAKRTRGEQYMFVNNRYIRDPYLNHAVMGAYEDMIAKDSFPLYVLFIDIDPAKIDINVHPTKTEIKFEEERYIYQIIKSVVRKSLGAHTITPELDFDTPVRAFNPMHGLNNDTERAPAEPDIKVNKGFNPFKDETRQKRNLTNWEKLYEPFRDDPEQEQVKPAKQEENLFSQEEKHHHFESFFQYKNEYIVTSDETGIVIIDQQAAHERVLFEQFIKQLDEQQSSSQQLLFPRAVELSPADYQLMDELAEEVRHLGFDINEFGTNTFIINGIPSDIKKGDAEEMLLGLLEHYKHNMSDLKLSRRELLARAMARNSCIVKGTALSDAEVNALLTHLYSCSNYRTTPSGLPIFVTFAPEELNRLFKKQ